MPIVLYERRDSFAVITLNHPEKLNALSREMILALSDILKDIESESDLRAVILTGAGEGAFCAGTDIRELAELDEEGAGEVSTRGEAVCKQIERFAAPVIAAVNGLAAGGGCELALACHIRFASIDATFSLPEATPGIIAAYSGTQRLARETGYGQALEMMLTGRVLTAAEALRIGLINRVVDGANLLTGAESLAREIGQLAPLAIRACLQAVTRGLELPLDKGLELEAELFASLFATEDMREGTCAFLEKRSPVFKGTRGFCGPYSRNRK